MKVIRLKDGPRPIAPATYYAFQLMSEQGFDILRRVADSSGNLRMTDAEAMTIAPIVLASLLTDSEELTEYGTPKRFWSPVEVAKLIDMATFQETMDAAWEMVREGLPQGDKDADAVPPTSPRRGSRK